MTKRNKISILFFDFSTKEWNLEKKLEIIIESDHKKRKNLRN